VSVSKLANGKYRARYRNPDGRQVAKHFTLKREAERWVTSEQAKVLTGEWVDLSNTITVAQYAGHWAAARPHRPTTARRVRSNIRKHISETSLGSRPMVKVRPSEVQGWVTSRAEILAPSTLKLLVGMLRTIFKSAVLDSVLVKSPVVGLTLPRASKERIVPLTVEQVRYLAEEMPERCRAMVITQAGLGLRIGELLALRVQDVNFLKRTVSVEWQLAEYSRERVALKTPRSKRIIPLPDIAADALASHIQEYPPADDGSLWTMKNGLSYIKNNYTARVFATAVTKAGLPEGTTTHSLRHHFVSVLLDAGASVVVVAEALGHEDGKLVLSTYAHLMPSGEDRTRKAIDSAWKTEDRMRTGGSQIAAEQAK
jgi:integrase